MVDALPAKFIPVGIGVSYNDTVPAAPATTFGLRKVRLPDDAPICKLVDCPPIAKDRLLIIISQCRGGEVRLEQGRRRPPMTFFPEPP